MASHPKLNVTREASSGTRTIDRRVDTSRVAAIKQQTKLSDLIGTSVRLRRRGRLYVGLCPFHVERTPSFTINDQRGFFHCFGCGAHGDHLDWLKHSEGWSFGEALDHLDGGRRFRVTNGGLRQVLRDEPKEDADSIAWARSLWDAALSPYGTLVETYLHSRGVDIPVPEVLRFAPTLRESQTGRRYPVMLAAIVDGAGELIGVHRTYLRSDGQGKAPITTAKKVAGRVAGGTIRLAPPGPLLGVAEGIETALSVTQATGLPCWAAVSLGNLAGPGVPSKYPVLHPTRGGVYLPSVEPDMSRPGIVLPKMVRAVELYVDADNRDPVTAERLVRRASRRLDSWGVAVRIVRPPEGLDFNDVLVRGERRSSGASR